MSQPNNNNHHEEAVGGDQNPPQRKRRNRHSQSQIQAMEAFFAENPHPTPNQREELSLQLGLHPLQIQSWFQNKRTKLKNHQERLENEQAQLRTNKRLIEESVRQLAKDKKMMIELAVGAMNELLVMAEAGHVLWLEGVDGMSLDFSEYETAFGNGIAAPLAGFTTEASISTATVAMDTASIVNMFMQTNQWSEMFVGMVNRATNHEQIASNVTGDGDLQVMSAEYMVPSPLVSTRESFFLRYCKKEEDGSWAVVDIFIDHLLPNMHPNSRRKPSGCLIQEVPGGYSMVTWVEHVVVDDRIDAHSIYKPLIRTGQAFGANRWVATLKRQCERKNRIMAKGFDDTVDSALTNGGRISILKLTNRIARCFFLGLTPSIGSSVSDDARDHIRVMTVKNSLVPGRPHNLILCATTSFWVCAPPKTVFDFLSDENNRTKWDNLSTGGNVQKILEIPNEKNNGISSTLLQNTTDTCDNKTTIVQESYFDPTASFVIYAAVDAETIQTLLSGGGDPDNVALLPSGFAIFPDGMRGGSLLTVASQILTEVAPNSNLPKSSYETVRNLIRNNMVKIQALFPPPTA